MMSFRRSDIQAFMRCPRAYQLKGFLSNPAMKMGSLIHEILFEYGNHCLDLDVKSDLGKLREILARRKYECPCTMAKDYEYLESRLDSNPAIIMTFRDKIDFEKKLEYEGIYHCTVDRMRTFEGYVEIDDYKTNRRPYTKHKTANSFQAKFYCMMAWLNNQGSCREVIFTFHFLRFNSSAKVAYTWDELEEFQKQIIEPTINDMNEAYRTGHFLKNIGEHCTGCHAIGQCLHDELRELDLLTTLSDDDLADQWLAAKAVSGAALKELKNRVEKTGPINHGGKVLDFHLTESTTFQYEDATRKLQNYLVPIENIKQELSFSPAAIKRLLKKGMEGGPNYKSFEKENATIKLGARFGLK